MTASARGPPAIGLLAQDAFSRPSGIARYQSELVLGMAPRVNLHLLVPGHDAYWHGKGLPPSAQSARVCAYGTGWQIARNFGRIVARMPGNGDLLTWRVAVCLNNLSSRLFAGTYLDRERYALVHGTAGFLPDTRGSTARVVTVHDTTPITMPERHTALTLGLFIKKRELRDEDFAIVGTRSALAEFQEVFDHPPDHTRVIPYGFDHARFHPAAEPRKEERLDPYILSVGSIEPRKNLVRMLKAFEHLADAHPGLRWKVVGPRAWGWEEFSAALEGSPARERVDLVGALPEEELIASYQDAAALVYPSLWEGFGYPVVEALACGIPVASSDIPSIREAGGNAFVPLDPERVDSIVEAVERAAFDGEGKDARRRVGLEHVRRFSWPRAVSEHIALYAEALGLSVDDLRAEGGEVKGTALPKAGSRVTS